MMHHAGWCTTHHVEGEGIFPSKHDKPLFEKEFTDNLAETIKPKKQSIEAITEVSKPNDRQPLTEQEEWGVEAVPQQTLQTR